MLLGNLRSVHDSYTPKPRSLLDSVSTLSRQTDSLTKFLTDSDDIDLDVDVAVKVGQLNEIVSELHKIADKNRDKERRGDGASTSSSTGDFSYLKIHMASVTIRNEQRADFERDGVICLRDMIEPALISVLAKGIDSCLEHPGPKGRNFNSKDTPGRFAGDVFMWTFDDAMRQFLLGSPLAKSPPIYGVQYGCPYVGSDVCQRTAYAVA